MTSWMPGMPDSWAHGEREWSRSIETASAQKPGDVVAGADGELHRWDACGWPTISSWGKDHCTRQARAAARLPRPLRTSHRCASRRSSP
jgi:hypothetical protein